MSDPWHIIDDPSHLAPTVSSGWLMGMLGAFLVVAALGIYLDSRQVKDLKQNAQRRRVRRDTADIFRPIFAVILFLGCMAVATYFMGVWHLPELRPESTTKPWQQHKGTPPQQ